MQSRFPRISSCIGSLLFLLAAHAQQNDIPLNRDIYYDIDRNGAAKGSTMHTGMRPIIESRAELHNVMGFRPDSGRYYYWITEKLFKEHLIQVKDGDFKVNVDPAFRFELAKEFREGTPYADDVVMQQNSRGFRIAADLGPTVSFQSMFMENQVISPGYLYSYSQRYGVMPGQGRIKAFNTRGLDFAWATGNVSWTPRPWINAQLGQGKHFVGDGYRSVLLSDNTSPYPYVKFSTLTNNKRFQYTAIFAKLQQVGLNDRLPTGEAGESLFWWKRATFLHLSANLGPLQLAVFEGTMWKTINKDGVMLFNAMQLNPVIGLNTAVNGFEGRNTQLLGLDAKYRITDKVFVYGQYALTDPGQSRYAWQAGMQWFDLLRKDLHLLAEYNQATPFAYTKGDPRMSWTHDNQPLAGPMGTEYTELIIRADYGIKQRYWFQGELSWAKHPWGLDMTEVSGADIFGPTRSNGEGDWTRRRLYAGIQASYRLNQMSNMQFTVGYTMRDLQPGPTGQDSGYLYVAFHTGLFNRYYDI
ncbi:MAG TPA: hypothetical protein PKD45_14315 [Flavobacteriales bacterium]|nr:hypothetical protein [Flavobacteriales bacterium]